MLNKKTLLAIPFFLLVGCGTASVQKEEVSLPNWYVQTPKSNSYFYGAGEGNSIEEAKNQALNHIASSLSVSISSNFKKSEGYSTGTAGTTSFRNVQNSVKAEVKKIDFSNVEVVHNKLIKGKYYILVKVNKLKLFNATKEKFLVLDNKIKSALSLNSSNPYEELVNINRVEPQIREAMIKTNLLYGINSSFDMKSYMNKYTKTLTKKEALLNKITISISNPNDSFSQKLIELLNEKHYKMARNGVVKIDIKTSPRFSTNYGMSIARVSVNIKVKANNKTIYSNNMEVKGISNRKEQALAKASINFKNKISKIGIEKILGIK